MKKQLESKSEIKTSKDGEEESVVADSVVPDSVDEDSDSENSVDENEADENEDSGDDNSSNDDSDDETSESEKSDTAHSSIGNKTKENLNGANSGNTGIDKIEQSHNGEKDEIVKNGVEEKNTRLVPENNSTKSVDNN